MVGSNCLKTKINIITQNGQSHLAHRVYAYFNKVKGIRCNREMVKRKYKYTYLNFCKMK